MNLSNEMVAQQKKWTMDTVPAWVNIGAFRAVWVHEQDLATPNLMQLRKAYFVTTLYAIRYVCSRIYIYMLYTGDHVSSRPVLMIWVRMVQNNSGNAHVCRDLQAPMWVKPDQVFSTGMYMVTNNYPIIILHVDICSLFNKVLYHFDTATFSCQVQGSHLVERK